MKKLDNPAKLTTCKDLFFFFAVFVDSNCWVTQPSFLHNLFNILTARLGNNDVILCILQEADHLQNACTKSSC